MVAEIASKFNAVVVDANQGDSMQDIMKKLSKTLAKGTTVRTKVTTVREKGVVVRATVEKFESTSHKKRCVNQMVVVRTNSNQRTVEERPTVVERRMVEDHRTAVEHPIAVELSTDAEQRKITDNLTAVEQPTTTIHPTATKNCTIEQRKTIDQQTPSSIVKKLLVQFENGKKPSKPSVLGPKPNVTTPSVRRNERRPLLQKDTISAVDRHLLNKDKRLSIARDPDALLESVLNVTPSPKTLLQPIEREQSPQREDLEQQLSIKTDRSTPQKDLNQQQSIETDRSPTRAILQQPTGTTTTRSPPPLPLKPNCSFLHGWKRPLTTTLTTIASTNAVTTTLAITTLDITTPVSTPSIISTPVVNISITTTPVINTTSTTVTSVATTITNHKGGRHSVDEECSSQLLSSLIVATPTTSVLAPLAEDIPTTTSFSTETTTVAANNTAITVNITADNTAEIGSHDYNYIVGDESIYEELRYIQLTPTDVTGTTEVPVSNAMVENPYIVDCFNDDHYTTIDGGEQNIYDVVTTATNAYEDNSYETVQPPLPPLPPPPPPVVSVTVTDLSSLQLPVDGHDDENGMQEKKEMSENSVEIDNSIYGINPPSESTSSGN